MNGLCPRLLPRNVYRSGALVVEIFQSLRNGFCFRYFTLAFLCPRLREGGVTYKEGVGRHPSFRMASVQRIALRH